MQSSQSARSLYNTNTQQVSAQPALFLQTLLAYLRSASDAKTIKNANIVSSTLDDTAIGTTLPNTARFTSFTTGLLNSDLQSVFNGPNNSQLIWGGGSLKLVNAGLSTPNLFLDALSKVSWRPSATGTTGGPYIRNTDANSLAVSDPILTIGDAASNTSSDMGIVMANHHFFGLRSASSRAATLTNNAYSFQCVPSPFAVSGFKKINASTTSATTSNATSATTSNATSATVAVECDWCFPQRIRFSSEQILLSSTDSVAVSVGTHTSKLYGLRTTAISNYTASLGLGDDDGQIKVVHYLPQTMLSSLQATTDASVSSTIPSLTLTGAFCLPPYGIVETQIVLTVFPLSVMLQYDAVLTAWVVVGNGIL